MSIKEQTKVVQDLVKKFGEENVTDAKNPRLYRAFATVKREVFRDVVKYLKEKHGFVHIVTISGVDMKDRYEVVYHLRSEGFNMNLKVPVPKDDPKVPSITGRCPRTTLRSLASLTSSTGRSSTRGR